MSNGNIKIKLQENARRIRISHTPDFVIKYFPGVDLRLVSAIFYQVFIFPPNHSLLKKTIYFIKKLFPFSRFLNVCNFFPSFPQSPDSKGQMKVE